MRRRLPLIVIVLLALILYGDRVVPVRSSELAPLPPLSSSLAAVRQPGDWKTYANGDSVQDLALADGCLWAATDHGGAVLWGLTGGHCSQYLRPQQYLASNRLQAVHVDHQGRVWFGTADAGVSVFDRGAWITYMTDNSRLPDNDIRDIVTDDQGRQWVATAGGVGIFEAGEFLEPLTTANSGLLSNDVRGISIGPDGHLWFATGSGASEFDGSTWTSYRTPMLVDDRVNTIAFEGETRVWFGTEAGVSIRYGSRWMECRVNETLIWDDDHVRSIAVDDAGRAWVGHSEGVIVLKWPAAAQECEVVHTFTAGDSGLASDDVRDVLINGQGQKWFATDDGVSVYDGSDWQTHRTGGTGLAGNTVNDMALDTHGRLWFATSSILTTGAQGLSVLSQDAWTSFRVENSGLPGDRVQALAIEAREDGESVWVGTSAGAGRYAVDSGEWITYTATTSGLQGDDVRTITVDRTGQKWFGVREVGVCIFDEFSPVEPRWRCYKPDAGRMPIDRVNVIVLEESEQQTVAWIGTGGGLIKYDGQTWRTYTQSDGLAANDVRAIAIDALGRKWLATPNGVSIYDGVGFDRWHTDNSGLISDDVHEILIDDEGAIWFGTVKGVSVFDGAAWTDYTTANSGLVCDDVRVIVREGQGRVWFGTARCGASVMEAGAASADITIMMAATAKEVVVIRNQINRFMEAHPNIQVRLRVEPYSRFSRTLLDLISAGTPPDVAVLSYNYMAVLQSLLRPQDDLLCELNVGRNEFLTDALNSDTFNSQLYALPWRRSACVPHYHNLVLFKESQHPTEAFMLVDFLTREEQQQENYAELEWFPTQQSFYGPSGIACPDIQVIRPDVEDVSRLIEVVDERSPELDPLLGEQALNAYEASAVVERDLIRLVAAPVRAEDEVKLYLPLVLSSGGSHATASAAASITARPGTASPTDGVIVGALFITDTIGVQDSSGVTVALQGDYVVKCDIRALGPCILMKSDGTETEVIPDVARVTAAPVGEPFTTVEMASVGDFQDGSRVGQMEVSEPGPSSRRSRGPQLQNVDSLLRPLQGIRVCFHVLGVTTCIRIG